jgi:hypothetical protein
MKKKTARGFVELQDDPTSLPPQHPHHHHAGHDGDDDDTTNNIDHLEDVSLGGGGSGSENPAWLARHAPIPHRGSSNSSSSNAPPSSSSSTTTTTTTTTERAAAAGTAAAKRWLGLRARWPPAPEAAAAAAGLGWLGLALLLASMNPSVLAGLMYGSAARRELVYTPVSILGAANLVGLLLAVRCVVLLR